MSRRRRHAWLVPAMTLVVAAVGRADVTMTTRAMKATTIAELYVDRDQIELQLEIGRAEWPAYADLLEGARGPEAVRRWCTQSGLRLVKDDDTPLVGDVEERIERVRVARDEITGEPDPMQTGNQERVRVVRIRYRQTGEPARLRLCPPVDDEGELTSDLGFVVYHRGLAVNDFRNLRGEEPLNLDWDDPWHSRFENRTLRRQFDTPLAVFLYVENMEVRKEILIRPRDLQGWLDLGVTGEVIAAADQEALKQKVAEFLRPRGKVLVNGQLVSPELDRVHFVERTRRQTVVVDPPRDLPAVAAMLGVIFVYPINELPQEVTLDWDLFNDRIRTVPCAVTDEAGAQPSRLDPQNPTLVWQNLLQNPRDRQPVEVAVPEATGSVAVPVASLALGIGALTLLLRGRSRRRVPAVGLAVIGAVLLWPHARVTVSNPMDRAPALDPDAAHSVMSALLENVYRAFDYRGEEAIYDALAHSAAGELLVDVYLETRRGLELENQGGARIKVQSMELLECEVTPADGRSFEARCRWNVIGSVGHWGHIHQRRNQYEASFEVDVVDEAWKLVGMELLSEQRI